jgi:L-fucose mutarotase
MLKGKLIHPDIMAALALCGHGDKVLIADGNYPLDSQAGDGALVYLGLMPGPPTVTDVLEAVQSVVNVEKAEVMDPADGTTPEIFGTFTEMLDGMKLDLLGRYEFYDACCDKNVRLAISTGEQRIFANILITVGVA